MKLDTILFKLPLTAVICIFFTACQKETTPAKDTVAANDASVNNVAATETDDLSARGGGNTGHVYTLSNETTGNKVIDYSRSHNGTLTWVASYPTGGNGTGGGLGNQGAVIICGDDEDENILLAVNAGSNTVSSFKIKSNGLELKSTVSSGGMRPVSLTQNDDVVFVLNAGDTNNISGFKLYENGTLHPIAGSARPLSAAMTGPAQVSFVNDGRVLVITEKATNKIVTYTVNENGIPGMMHTITSSSPTPFGFAVGKEENIFVSEAVGGAPGASVLSSYHVNNNGIISLVNGSIGAGQSAACWVVITNNGKYAYTTNTASNNLSTFRINNAGNISLSQAISGITQAGPIDAALSNNSKFLYVLNSGGHSINAFSVASDGTLNIIQTVAGVPAGATGLASK